MLSGFVIFCRSFRATYRVPSSGVYPALATQINVASSALVAALSVILGLYLTYLTRLFPLAQRFWQPNITIFLYHHIFYLYLFRRESSNVFNAFSPPFSFWWLYLPQTATYGLFYPCPTLPYPTNLSTIFPFASKHLADHYPRFSPCAPLLQPSLAPHRLSNSAKISSCGGRDNLTSHF